MGNNRRGYNTSRANGRPNGRARGKNSSDSIGANTLGCIVLRLLACGFIIIGVGCFISFFKQEWIFNGEPMIHLAEKNGYMGRVKFSDPLALVEGLFFTALGIVTFFISSKRVRENVENYSKRMNKRSGSKRAASGKNPYVDQYGNVNNTVANIIVECPACKQKQRFPAAKGRLLATCPRCKYEFYTET